MVKTIVRHWQFTSVTTFEALIDQQTERVATDSRDHPIILFDGVCNLCNRTVDFIIERDPKCLFRFASLQSKAGELALASCGIDSTTTDSVVLIEEGRGYVSSTAALRIVRHLGAMWPALYGLVLVPRPLRDAVYDIIAKRRYRWFGKREACRLPSSEEQALFL